MVERCQINETECIVLDFDNTVLSGNSTELLAVFLIKRSLHNKKFKEIISLFSTAFFRKIRLIPHRTLQHRIATFASKNLNESDLEEFADSLSEKFNPEIIGIAKTAKDRGQKVLIASGACDIFFPYLMKRWDTCFDDYLASGYTAAEKDYIENRGETKKERVISYLNNNSLMINSFYTDDYKDDLPLIRYSPGKAFLVDKSGKISPLNSELINKIERG